MKVGKNHVVDDYDDVATIKLGPQCQGLNFDSFDA